jgi:hypothetical protein
MLRWCREGRIRLVVAALVSVAVLVAWVGGDHGAVGHDGHGLAWVVHDASAHAFTSGDALPGGEALHCVLCHATRSLRPAADVSTATPHRDQHAPVVSVSADRVPHTFPAAQPPLRSPPVLL